MVRVIYLIFNTASSYNIVIRRTSFNALEASLLTLYLTMKYPLGDGQVGVIKGDQGLERKCYKYILKLIRKAQPHNENTSHGSAHKVNLDDLDPQDDPSEDSLTHMIRSNQPR